MKFSNLDLDGKWQAVSVEYENPRTAADRREWRRLLGECKRFETVMRRALERKAPRPRRQRGRAA